MVSIEEVLNTLCLFDDAFMRACFKNHRECIELVVRIVLNNPDLEFVQFKDQENIPNLNGKEAVLDFVLRDKDGKLYDVEIESQNSRSGVYERRTRYYSSLLDSYYLGKGQSYINLPDSFVIFFSRKDLIGAGLPLYTIKSKVTETGEEFEDGRNIILVNGEIQDDSALGRLVKDFRCTNTEAMCYAELKKAREEAMISYKVLLQRPDNPVLEEYVRQFEDKAFDKGEKEGRREERLNIARAMLKKGLSAETIAQCTCLSVEEVKKLK